jgi:hypothetical protein
MVGIASRSAATGPARKQIDSFGRERKIVSKMPATGIGEPWGHRFRAHRAADGFSPGPRFPIRHERHGCDLAMTMATVTMLLQDGQYVAIEGRRRFVASPVLRPHKWSDTCGQQSQGHKSPRSMHYFRFYNGVSETLSGGFARNELVALSRGVGLDSRQGGRASHNPKSRRSPGGWLS